MQASDADRNQEIYMTGAPTGVGHDEVDTPKPPSGACSLFCQSGPCRAALIAVGTLLVLTGFAGIALSIKLNLQERTASYGIPVSGIAIFAGVVLIFCSYGLRMQSNGEVTETQLTDLSGRRSVTAEQGGDTLITSVLGIGEVSAEATYAARQRLVVMQNARATHLGCYRDSNPPSRPTAAAVRVAARLSRGTGMQCLPSGDNSSTAVIGLRHTLSHVTEQSAQIRSNNFHSACLDHIRLSLDLHHGLVGEQETAINGEAPPYVSVVLLPADLATAAPRLSNSSSQRPPLPPQSPPQLHTTPTAPSYEQALLISEPVVGGSRVSVTSSANSVVERLPRSRAPHSALYAQQLPPPSYEEVCS